MNDHSAPIDDLYAAWRQHVLACLIAIAGPLGPEIAARIELTPPRDAKHGDLTTNAALIAAKSLGRNPRELATALAAALVERHGVGAEPAGPGFVNLRLDAASLQATLRPVLRLGERYGASTLGAGRQANVEFVSANPTGPVHVGHGRGAVVGDALANLLERAGFAVTREYYVNDAGGQVVTLAWATYWRVLQALGTTLTEAEFSAAVPGGLQYRGDYLVPVGEAIARRHGLSLAAADGGIAETSVWFETVREECLDAMMATIRDDLALLGIRHDVFTSERAVLDGGMVGETIERLADAGLLYEGVLEPPKGKVPEDWEPRPQLLFRSTAFGDDVDRPLRKSDGTNTYFANDIGYHADKLRRGADVLVDVLGADHGGYVPRMRAAIRALAGDVAPEGARERMPEGAREREPKGAPEPAPAPPRDIAFEVVLCQIVHLVRGGEPVRMSKRAGSFVTIRDLIEEVGRDAVRFTMLTRRPDAQMEFDLDEVVAQTRENPVFYVQYAHARCRSVLRAAAEMLGADAVRRDALVSVDLAPLADEAELALIRRIASFPRLIAAAAAAREPHRIAFYLADLAADFHALWNRGTADATLRFLHADRPDETRARLALVEATATTIRAGLDVLGVAPVEEMR